MSASTHARQPSSGLLIADGQEVLRLGLRTLFSPMPRFQMLGEAETGEQCLAMYERLKPAVLVMDLLLPDACGIDVLQRVMRADPEARVVVYTAMDSQSKLDRALNNGAMGFVTKSNAALALVRAVEEAAEGRRYVSEDLLRGMLQSRFCAGNALLRILTAREHEIFLLLARGRTVKQCAHILGLSDKTVSNHATQIKHKLGVGNQTELARMAMRLDLVD